jgi:alternate signal-mediated exported protein
MKNSTLMKGSAAIALGAALLLGGGGTLANWNAAVSQTPGTVVAGDLNVVNGVGAAPDVAYPVRAVQDADVQP